MMKREYLKVTKKWAINKTKKEMAKLAR